MSHGVEHVALSVSNLERSIAFYTKHFGLTVKRIIESPPEKRLGDVVGLPGCAARIAHLVGGDGAMLELFEYLSPRGKPLDGSRTQADQGFTHVGFRTTDLAADAASLAADGVRFIGRPVEFRPGVWIVYFHGPDGEVGELRQSNEP